MRSLQEERPFVYGEPQPPNVDTGSYNVCTPGYTSIVHQAILPASNARCWLMVLLQMEVCHDDKDAKLRDGHGQSWGTTFNA